MLPLSNMVIEVLYVDKAKLIRQSYLKLRLAFEDGAVVLPALTD